MRFGTGWHPLSLSPIEVKKGRERIDRLCEEANRDPSSVEVIPRLMTSVMEEPWDRPVVDRRMLKGTVAELRAMLDAYAEAGVAEIVIDANSRDPGETRALMERAAAELML